MVAKVDPVRAEQALAEKSVAALFERDRASQALGMRITAVKPGYARVTMRVRADMLNGHDTCHGGLIFSLADTAFAFACNSRSDAAVAAACQVNYLKPGREGDLLEAEAVERTVAGRSGFYDVSVTNQAGELLALFRGQSHRLKKAGGDDARQKT
jgi:acyl-CoA thioesterase